MMRYLNSKVKQNLGEPAGELAASIIGRWWSACTETGRNSSFSILPASTLRIQTRQWISSSFRRRAHGRVVLVGELARSKQMNAAIDVVIRPRLKSKGVAGWGLANVDDDKAMAPFAACLRAGCRIQAQVGSPPSCWMHQSVEAKAIV